MRELIRFAPISINHLKIGEAENVTYDIETGDEIQIGADGVLGLSDGTATCTATFNAIIPVKGMGFQIDNVILNKLYVDIKIPLNGQQHVATGRITGVNYSTDAKTGRCTGQFKFTGGSPQLA